MAASGGDKDPATQSPAAAPSNMVAVPASSKCNYLRKDGVNWPCLLILLVWCGIAMILIVTMAFYPYHPFGVNGNSFVGEEDFLTTMQLGKVQEWEIGGGVAGFAHPGHVHINHMQLVSINGGLTESMGWRVGDWYDVIPQLNGGPATVRFPTDTFTGTVVLHCHILAHEDLGMMAVVNIE